MSRAWLAAALVAAALTAACGSSGSARPDPRPFSSQSVWNAPLADDSPLDPHSAALVGELRRIVGTATAAHDGPWIASGQYSTPVYTVPAGQRAVRVKLDVAERSNMQGAFAAVPLPGDARPAAGTDRHLTVWQPSTDRLWEFWQLARRADGWHARWGGAMEHVSKSPGYFEASSWPGARPYWGATASSLPLLGGLITRADVTERRIDHALAFALPAIRSGAFAAPAQRTDGRDPRPGAIPMGARFRLDPALDLDSLHLPPITRMIAEAVKRHGMILRDTASTIQFYAEDFTATGPDPLPDLIGPDYPNTYWRQLAAFPWDRLQLLKMDLSSKAGAP
jgi:hypothetical protein